MAPHTENVPLYSPVAQPLDKPLDDNKEDKQPPATQEELLAQLQSQVAEMAIERDRQDERIRELQATRRKDNAPQSTRKVKLQTPAPFDNVSTTPKLPPPMHVQFYHRISKMDRKASRKYEGTPEESATSDTDDEKRRRRRRRQRTPDNGDPSSSPSSSDSEDSHGFYLPRRNLRALHRQNARQARPRSVTPVNTVKYAHGSQIATLKNYDGREGSQALIWLRDTETAARKFNWSEPVLIDAASGKLTGGAKKWYDQEINWFQEFNSWEAFSKALLAHYYPKGLAASAAAQMEKLKLDAQPQMQTLYDKLRELAYFQHEKLFADSVLSRRASARRTAVQAAENTVFNAFKSKLPREMLLYVMSKEPEDSRQMLQHALQYEEEMRHAAPKQEKNTFVSAISKNNPKHADLTCHYCGRKGHIQPDCRTKAKEMDGQSNYSSSYRGRGRGGSSYSSGRGRGSTSSSQGQSRTANNDNQQSSYRGRGRGRGTRRGAAYAIGYDDPNQGQNDDAEARQMEQQGYSEQQRYNDQPQVSFPGDNAQQENY